MKELSDNFKRVPIEEIQKPKQGLLDCYVDHWWAVTKNNEVLLFKEKHPQCHSQKFAVDRLMNYEGCTAIQIPFAFIKVSANDFI